ncbi:MAG: hypothetical protein AMJ81_00930 [Phycisphaerae bacterium SM23_33]|nr:MAG: hypothetical protein AMJ81_00930 [Phycisphaerae bacterium SM23_33]
MRIPQHWANESFTGQDRDGKEQTFRAWGWSFESLRAARDDALARARRIFDCLVSGRRPESYEYLRQPLREEIVQSVQVGEKAVGVVTRNRYGALVLNSSSVLFADVDFPPARSRGLLDSLRLALSSARRAQRAQELRDATLDGVRAWVRAHPRSCRVYRTLAGLRVLFTDRLYDPVSAETRAILAELESDALYRRLTEQQQCFRARLTPKPWRCGCKTPPNRYPWPTPQAEQAYRQWERQYAEKTRSHKTCELIEAIGVPSPAEEIQAIIRLHDGMACDRPGTMLA